jgi:hypothetical protein
VRDVGDFRIHGLMAGLRGVSDLELHFRTMWRQRPETPWPDCVVS